MIETIICPGCAASFPGSPALMGKRVRCRKCKQDFSVPHDASGLEFLDDEEDCGLEFLDEPPAPTILATLDDELGLAAVQQAPQGLLERTYVVPIEPRAPRKPFNALAFAGLFSFVLGLALLGVGWLSSGGEDQLYLAFYVMGAVCSLGPIAFCADRQLVQFEGYRQFQFALAIIAVIGNLIALLFGAAGQ